MLMMSFHFFPVADGSRDASPTSLLVFPGMEECMPKYSPPLFLVCLCPDGGHGVPLVSVWLVPAVSSLSGCIGEVVPLVS